MADIHSRKDIEKISLEILKSSKAIDIFPTPIDQIVNYSNLIIAKNIDVSKIEHGFLSRISDTLQSGLQKIRGILDREEKIIYLDLSQSKQRQGFVKLHEVGHDILPWQKEIMECLDDDNTLSALTKKEFEVEANYFASITLFQQDRFNKELERLPLSMDAPMHLAKHFGASNHAAFRRYVECSKKRCALLVLENISARGKMPSCNVRDYFQSSKFTKDFGEIIWQTNLGYTWDFVQDYYHGRKVKKDGVIEMNLPNNEKAIFSYHFFNSTYNAFVLFFPLGEVQKSKVTFVYNQVKK